MEYADQLIREAERRYEEIHTPYDDQLSAAQTMSDKTNMLLALMRAEISDYCQKYSDAPGLADALLEVEGGMRDALLDVVSTLKYKAENHQHEEE